MKTTHSTTGLDLLRSGIDHAHVAYVQDSRFDAPTYVESSVVPTPGAPTLRVRMGRALISLGRVIGGIAI